MTYPGLIGLILAVILLVICSLFFLKMIWRNLDDSSRMVLPIALFVFILLAIGGLILGGVLRPSLK